MSPWLSGDGHHYENTRESLKETTMRKSVMETKSLPVDSSFLLSSLIATLQEMQFEVIGSLQLFHDDQFWFLFLCFILFKSTIKLFLS